MLVSLAVLLLLSPSVRRTNLFGIGCYDDTPGSPPIDSQLDAAQRLVGPGGWVVVYLCAWRNASASCMNASTTTSDPQSRAKLLAAYARNLTVVARIGNPFVVRDHADPGSSNYTSYKQLAAAYAKFVASLPLPNPPPECMQSFTTHH